MAKKSDKWLSAQENWYWGTGDINSAMEEIAERAPDLIVDDAATRVLVDRIGYAMNGPFLALQDAIGQTDGGIASVFASGWDTVMAARVATDILASGAVGHTPWDGKSMPPDWDGSPSLDLGKSVKAAEVTDADVRAVVNAFVDGIAKSVGIEAEAIDEVTRDDLVAWFREYLETEAAYERADDPTP